MHGSSVTPHRLRCRALGRPGLPRRREGVWRHAPGLGGQRVLLRFREGSRRVLPGFCDAIAPQVGIRARRVGLRGRRVELSGAPVGSFRRDVLTVRPSGVGRLQAGGCGLPTGVGGQRVLSQLA